MHDPVELEEPAQIDAMRAMTMGAVVVGTWPVGAVVMGAVVVRLSG